MNMLDSYRVWRIGKMDKKISYLESLKVKNNPNRDERLNNIGISAEIINLSYKRGKILIKLRNKSDKLTALVLNLQNAN